MAAVVGHRRWAGLWNMTDLYAKRIETLGTQKAAQLEMKEMYAIEKRRRKRALGRSRRNQPPKPVYSQWVCDECGNAGQTVQGPSGCFRELHCYGCGRKTEHAGVIMIR